VTTPKKTDCPQVLTMRCVFLVRHEYAVRWFVTKQSTTKPKVGGV